MCAVLQNKKKCLKHLRKNIITATFKNTKYKQERNQYMVHLYEFLRWFLMLIYNHKAEVLSIISTLVIVAGIIIKNPVLLSYAKNIIKKIYDYIKTKFTSFKEYIKSKFSKEKKN